MVPTAVGTERVIFVVIELDGRGFFLTLTTRGGGGAKDNRSGPFGNFGIFAGKFNLVVVDVVGVDFVAMLDKGRGRIRPGRYTI